ncbi:hypothetical protein ED733_003217 [Metarhizium rileyi]|uniref:F-box domain-containing protein n=1 Tax=Metarhizium rileyi (strain RCEF 4871) TaxID=1649241 RepID=A0A5C6G9Q4_METRR|nr:hypothetical protein ED733_003217 [Metarhizium rileyi]
MTDTTSEGCSLHNVPLEVLLNIVYPLSTTDLGCLRLTSRFLEQSLYTTFADEFFTRKQFMISDDSLQALVDISHSRLAHHLRSVHFGLDRFADGIQRPLSDDEKERKFRERYANNFTLWNTGHHRDMMAEAFRNLPNLEGVVIRDGNSRRQSRNGPNTEWHSYGYTTAFNETGVSLNPGLSSIWNTGLNQYCSQVFIALLFALGAAKAKIKGIEILSRNFNHLHDFAFNIPKYLEPTVVPVLQGLEKLHLCIDLSWRSQNVELVSNTGPNRSASDLSLRTFLSHTTNLRNLRINENHTNSIGLANFIDWVVDGGSDGTNISMPKLEELSLGTMNIDSTRLLKLISKFATSIQSLEIWKVTMVHSLQPDVRGLPTNEVFWSSFLTKLTEVPGLELRHLKLGMLKQHWRGVLAPAPINFVRTGPTIQYTGIDWKLFVEEIIPLMEAPHFEIDDLQDDILRFLMNGEGAALGLMDDDADEQEFMAWDGDSEPDVEDFNFV